VLLTLHVNSGLMEQVLSWTIIANLSFTYLLEYLECAFNSALTEVLTGAASLRKLKLPFVTLLALLT
jgi:hypothetical protein